VIESRQVATTGQQNRNQLMNKTRTNNGNKALTWWLCQMMALASIHHHEAI